MQEMPSNETFFELSTLDDLFLPIRNAPRVKYTCFDVSNNLVILGATSGSLYVFLRDPLKFLRVIPNKEGPVVVIVIRGNEQHVAFATRGTVVILEQIVADESHHNIISNTGSGNPRHLYISREHRGTIVTALRWNTSSGCLFVADDQGTVTAINISINKTQTLLQVPPTSTVVRLKSRIVQLDFLRDKLLISTLTGCYLCDTSKEQYSQIGSKPRDGEFGACFSWRCVPSNAKQNNSIIYAARPGSRLWEIDSEGNVLYTHQLKKALARSLEPLVSIRQEFYPTSRERGTPQSLNFGKLLAFGDNHLITWVDNRLFIFDTSTMTVSLSTQLTDEIVDLRLLLPNHVYVSHRNNQLRWLQLLPIEIGLHRLLHDFRWRLAGMVCTFYDARVTALESREWLSRSALEELENHLNLEDAKELAASVSEVLLRLQESVENTNILPEKHYRLESGIYVVNMPKKRGKQLQLPFRSHTANNSPDSLSPRSGSPTPDSLNGNSKRSVDDAMIQLKFMNAASWDMDAGGYLTLTSMKPNVTLGEIKNSLSSTYKSGKKRILNTMGKLEEQYFKSTSTEDLAIPFDVQHYNYVRNIREPSTFSMDTEEEHDSIIYPKKNFVEHHQSNYEEKAFAKQLAFVHNIQTNLEPLFEATNEAWDNLQDQKIMSDIVKLKTVLQTWVEVLNSTKELWYRALAHQLNQSNNHDDPHSSEIHKSKSCNNSVVQQNSPDDSSKLERLETRNSQDISKFLDEDMKVNDDAHCNHQQTLSLEDVLLLQDMTTNVSNPKSTNDYCWLCNPKYIACNAWELSSQQKKTITQLATMCVKMKTFGRISRYCELRQCWTKIDCLEADDSSSDVIGTKCLPSIALLKQSELILDRARSLFIKQYFGLVKTDEVFQDVRSDEHWSGNSWACILNGLMATTSGVQSSNLARGLRCDLRSMNPFLSILRSDIRDSSTIVQKLTEVNEKILCRDVLYFEPFINCQNGIFLRYMDEIFWNNKLNDTEEIRNEDEIAETTWVQQMLQSGPILNVELSKCTICGNPKSFSNLHPWKYQKQLVCILKSSKLSTIGPLYLELCEEYGFWLGKLHLLHKSDSRNEMIKLLVQLGDAGLLQDSNNSHLLPQSMKEWDFLFDQIIGQCTYCCEYAQCKPNTSKALKRMSVEDGALLMLQHCESQIVITLIQKLIRFNHNVTFSFNFYRTCLLSAAVRQRPSVLSYDILKNTCNNVWSKRAHYASPEVKATLLQKDDSTNIQRKKVEINSRTNRYLDGRQCHWGVHLDLASCCHVCSLPLGLLSSKDGVRIYPCGHGYHRTCVNSDVCVVCKQSTKPESTHNPVVQNLS